jgi:glycosyltransferase involved in cell wall biosynthesis
MRILHCIPSLGGGGAERQLSYLAPGLAALGHDVHVAYLSAGVNLEYMENGAVTLHPLRVVNNNDPSLAWHLVRLISEIEPDLLQTWMLQMDVFGGLAACLTRTPWVVREYTNATDVKSTIKKRLRLFFANHANAIVANSFGGLDWWDARGRPANRRMVPNALPLETIAAIPVDSLSEYGVTPRHKVVLYAGRFSQEKNIFNLINAVDRLVKEDASVIALICGEGPLWSEARRIVETLGITGQVILPGYLANIWGAMKRANVFLSVSHQEGRPNAVIEAMACGTALVLSRIPGHCEILDEKSALFVDREDVSDIVRTVRTCLANPMEAKRRAAVGQATVAGWSIGAVAEQYARIYADIVRKR